MGDDVITTGVDDLLVYLKGKDKVPMQDVAKVLNIPMDTVQAWVDFLVEEKILGIEYKFTKPFIYLNKETKPEKAKVIDAPNVSIDEVRKEYIERAKTKRIPQDKIAEFWKSHVTESLARKKEHFIEQATRRHVDNVQELWQEYQQNLLQRC